MEAKLKEKSIPKKYEDLAEAIKTARSAAIEAAKKERFDGGACNFDSCVIRLPRWNKELVKKSFESANLRVYYRESGYWKGYHINNPIPAQGDLNTVQTKAIYKILRDSGYSVEIYYQMD